MSRLSDALGVPEGKPFKFEGRVYVIKGNRRCFKYSNDKFKEGDSEKVLAKILDNPSEIKLLPTRYKRKEPEIVEVWLVDNRCAPKWVPDRLINSTPYDDYIVRDSTGSIKVYTPEGFESTFEEVK